MFRAYIAYVLPVNVTTMPQVSARVCNDWRIHYTYHSCPPKDAQRANDFIPDVTANIVEDGSSKFGEKLAEEQLTEMHVYM